jgi:CHAD domain-containing protein
MLGYVAIQVPVVNPYEIIFFLPPPVDCDGTKRHRRRSGLTMSAISRRNPAGDALRRKFRKTLGTVIRDLGAKNSDAHSPRRRLKYLRSLLVMMRPALGRKTFKRADSVLLHTARSMSNRRKAEAMLETVTKLRGQGLGPSELSALDALESILANSPHASVTSERMSDYSALGRDLAGLRRTAKNWSLPARNPSAYVEGLGNTYGRARKRLRQGLVTGRIADLHEARKSIIHHLHHIQSVEAIWPSVFQLWVKELEMLREYLGEINDYDDLTSQLANSADKLDPGARQTLKRLLSKRIEPLKKTVALASAHLFQEKPKVFVRRMDRMWREFAS